MKNVAKNITFVVNELMRTLRITYLLFAFALACVARAQVFDSPKYEYRAVWLTVIENLDWPSEASSVPLSVTAQKRELVTILDSLKALNVNTVLLQTRVRGDLIYPSSLEPFSPLFTGTAGQSPGYDPLAFAIEECHKRGMQLHAWVVTLPLGKDEHIEKLGKHALPHRDRSLCTKFGDSWFMEPGNPATSAYITEIVKEIVANYDVDGIHLDYIRYPDSTNGYPDSKLYRKYGKGNSLDTWRRGNITRIVKDVYACVKSVKPWVRVSCAPLGKYDNLTRYSSLGWDALNTCFQEAQQWLCDGVMDILFPMLYFKGNNFYPFVRDWQENACGRHVVPGIGIYRLLPEYGGWDKSEISRQLFTTRAVGCAGTAVFRSAHLTGNASGACDIYSFVYRAPALVPPMTWYGTSVPTPEMFEPEPVYGGYRLQWSRVEPADGLPAVKYNVYACYGDSVDTDDPKNMLATMLEETAFVVSGSRNATRYPVDAIRYRNPSSITFSDATLDEMLLMPSKLRFNRSTITIAVTAVDAFGVESKPVKTKIVKL